ncbi:hypothetical protein, partial [Leisingera sp. F5]|uniref:hypothetical protein n=1 Tax=Leisingera sp. F5 TaxID=1813816 RepID=UPI0025BA9309
MSTQFLHSLTPQKGSRIGKRLDAVDLRRCDERSDAAPGAAAFIMAGEERVLSRQGDRTEQVLAPLPGRQLRSDLPREALEPIPTRLSCRKTCSPSYWRWMQAGFSPRWDFEEIRRRWN